MVNGCNGSALGMSRCHKIAVKCVLLIEHIGFYVLIYAILGNHLRQNEHIRNDSSSCVPDPDTGYPAGQRS